MVNNYSHLSFSDFLKSVSLITLKDSNWMKNKFNLTIEMSSKVIDGLIKVIDPSMILTQDVKKDIVVAMYDGNSVSEKSRKISEKYSIPTEKLTKIFLGLKKSETLKENRIDFSHEGKKPLGKWSKHPRGYQGFDDRRYGTAFQTTYIDDLNLFFVVIDLDAHHADTDIPLVKLMEAIPKEFLDTRIINTPTDGKHIYYLSKSPLKGKDSDNLNIDYQTIKSNKVVKTKKGYKAKGSGGYVISSFRWNFNGEKKEYYKWDENSNKDILILDNVDDVLSLMYTNLHNSGLIDDTLFEKLMEVGSDGDIDTIVDELSELTTSGENANNLIYDDDGIMELNRTNAVQLITSQAGNIIKKTQGKHSTVLLALEGGLEKLGFNESERQNIIFGALDIANDLTSEHRSQVQLSIKKTGKQQKIGFPTLEREVSEIKEEIRIIKNISRIFRRSISALSLKLIMVVLNDLLEILSDILNDGLELDDDFDEFVNKNISHELDLYLEMKGLGLYERCTILKECFIKLNKSPKSVFEKYIFELITNGNEKYGISIVGKSILPYNNTSFGKSLTSKLGIKDSKISDKIDDLLIKLDMQISLMQRKAGNEIYIQPLINLIERPKFLPEYKRQQIALGFLRDNCCLKKTDRKNYIYDDVVEKAYVEVNERTLGSFLTKKWSIMKIGVEESELKKILSMTGEVEELKDEYCIFENGVLNMNTRKFKRTTNFKNYFTTKKVNSNLFFDDSPLDLNPINKPPSCLFEKTLMEILIPNYNINSSNLEERFYHDFLERVGSAFNTKIKDKKFPCYYGNGDNGKGILIEILKLTFAKRFLLITMDVLKDDKFDYSDYDVIVIDELDKSSFNNAISFIKRISGGEEHGTAQRAHYTHGVYVPKNPSAFFLFTNKIPEVDLTDDAFYRRMDIIPLQNKFTVNPNPNNGNEFNEDADLKLKLAENKHENVQWLVNASLQSYYNKHDGDGKFLGFSCGQSSAESKLLAVNTDPMIKFLMENYELDRSRQTLTKNSSICIAYENFCIREKISFYENNLNANIGKAIKHVFGDVKKPKKDGSYYYIRKKKYDDDKVMFLRNEEYDWSELVPQIPYEEKNNYSKVYERIDELSKINTPPTKELLKSEFHMFNVEQMVSKMKKIGLITQVNVE